MESVTPTVDTQKQFLIRRCGSAFSPSAPIDQRSLFAGRSHQIRKLMGAIDNKGQHAIIYGRRGSGKTSITGILRELLDTSLRESSEVRVESISCDPSQTFEKAWRNILQDIHVIQESSASKDIAHNEGPLSERLDDPSGVGPLQVRRALELFCGYNHELVLIFDEFDRLPDSERQLFADLIKGLSDKAVPATVILVGVASNVSELIDFHESTDRCVVQIEMPLMPRDELREIVGNGLKYLDMQMAESEVDLIVSLSRGLPHYVHLLAQQSASVAIDRGLRAITRDCVDAGLKEALASLQLSVSAEFQKAISVHKGSTLFGQVLLGCALSETDERGTFVAHDVCKVLQGALGLSCTTKTFASHLEKLSVDESRGPALERIGTVRNYRFRFRNPLLAPFVVLNGFSSGTLPEGYVRTSQFGKPLWSPTSYIQPVPPPHREER